MESFDNECDDLQRNIEIKNARRGQTKMVVSLAFFVGDFGGRCWILAGSRRDIVFSGLGVRFL